jgi:hypothetical protein
VAISRAKDPKKLLLDYSSNNFTNHLKKCIRVSQKVKDFYENSKVDRIEEDTLF